MPSVVIRLDIDGDKIEIGNETVGFAKFDCTAKDIRWARRFAENIEEDGVEVEVEEKD